MSGCEWKWVWGSGVQEWSGRLTLRMLVKSTEDDLQYFHPLVKDIMTRIIKNKYRKYVSTVTKIDLP